MSASGDWRDSMIYGILAQEWRTTTERQRDGQLGTVDPPLRDRDRRRPYRLRSCRGVHDARDPSSDC